MVDKNQKQTEEVEVKKEVVSGEQIAERATEAEPATENDNPFDVHFEVTTTDETETVYPDQIIVYPTPILLYRQSRIGRDGNTYFDYFAGVAGKLNGVGIIHKVNFKLSAEYREAYDRVNLLFGDKNNIPMSVVRTEMTDNRTNRKSVIYQIQISAIEDDGTEYALQLRPANANDRKEFETMLAKLRVKGYIV